MINAVFNEYFQKSHIFLYPLLGIRRGVSVTPIKTYVSWGNYKPEDRRLVCLYHLRDDVDYVRFEQQILFKNKYFEDFAEVSEGNAVYVFDMNEFAKDWDRFLQGKYSKFSPKTKSEIKTYHGYKFKHYAYLESFLYPERFFGMYAQLLYQADEVEKGEALLRKVGELCPKPDLDMETLKDSAKHLHMNQGLV